MLEKFEYAQATATTLARIAGTVDSLSSLSASAQQDVDHSEGSARRLEPEANELGRLANELTRSKI